MGILYFGPNFGPVFLLDIVQIHGGKFRVGMLWGWQDMSIQKIGRARTVLF